MKTIKLILLIAMFCLLFSGCTQLTSMLGSSSQESDNAAPIEAQALATETPQPVQPVEPVKDEAEQAPTDTPVPAAETEQAEEAVPVEQANDVLPPADPKIVHAMVPQQSRYHGNQILVECNTGYNYAASSKYVIPKACDSWRNNMLERPISQDLQVFYPYLDILSAMAGMDNDWVFVSISLFDAGIPEDESSLYYFVEIDSNFDGRGDVLLAVENLSLFGSEWTVEGVSAWRDTNKDVGSINAVYADKSNLGDGYDSLIFDQGVGDDADLVWARRSPTSSKMVEISFKKSLLGGKASFMWWVGALQGEFDPAKFDLVDSYNEQEYFAVDTTCGWLFGVDGKGYLKQCYIPEPTPVPTNAPSCIKPPRPNPDPCWIWMAQWCQWVCFN